jgi:hypothetical protein
MPRWALAPAAAFVLAFARSLGYFVKETRPSWSPDGRRLAFSRDPGKILVMGSGEAELTRVPFDRAANGVAWVPAR